MLRNYFYRLHITRALYFGASITMNRSTAAAIVPVVLMIVNVISVGSEISTMLMEMQSGFSVQPTNVDISFEPHAYSKITCLLR